MRPANCGELIEGNFIALQDGSASRTKLCVCKCRHVIIQSRLWKLNVKREGNCWTRMEV